MRVVQRMIEEWSCRKRCRDELHFETFAKNCLAADALMLLTTLSPESDDHLLPSALARAVGVSHRTAQSRKEKFKMSDQQSDAKSSSKLAVGLASLIGIAVVCVLVCVLVAIVVIAILTITGPEIGNVFSRITYGLSTP